MHPGTGIAVVAVVFWIFVGAVSIAGMVQDYRKRQLALEPLRVAIEHGQQLTPEIIAKLLGREAPQQELDPRDLQVGGIITCASGLGVALLAIFVALVFPPYHWLVLGVGVVAVCVGIGLLIAARVVRRSAARITG
jgi:membrane protein YdbS with pleckstrin-like domain